MSLTLPTAQQLYDFWGPEADETNIARTNLWIQAGADLVFLATGITDDDPDPQKNRFIQYALMDMAVWFMANRENVTENYNEFSGETIGSYSYNKSFRKMAATAGQGNTGVYFFDLLVAAMTTGMWAVEAWTASENVFHSPQRRYVESERLLHRPVVALGGTLYDPSGFGNDGVMPFGGD